MSPDGERESLDRERESPEGKQESLGRERDIDPDELRKRTKMNRTRLIILVFSFSLIFISLYRVGIDETFEALGAIEPWAIVLAALLTILVLANDCMRWKVVLDYLVKMPFRSIVPIFLAGMFINNITPGVNSGGEIVRTYYISKETGKKPSETGATVLLDAMTLGLAFVVFVIFAVAFVFLSPDVNLPGNVRILFGLAAALVLGVMSYAFYYLKFGRIRHRKAGKSRLSSLLGWIFKLKISRKLREKHKSKAAFEEYVRAGLRHFLVTMRSLSANPRLMFTATSMSVVTILVMYLRAYVLFRGMGEDIPFTVLCAILTVAYLLGYLIILPGGIGVVESVMIALYDAYGIAPEVAAAVTVVDRTLWYVFTFSGGYASLVHLTGRDGKKKEESAEEEGVSGEAEGEIGGDVEDNTGDGKE